MENSNDPMEYSVSDVIAGLNQMRDTLTLLSALIKDYRAQNDWDIQGETFNKTLAAIDIAKQDLNLQIRSTESE